MWAGMRVDGDRKWILEALTEGTRDIAHDGSYQPDVSKDVCSTAMLFRCRRTKRQLHASFAEKSTHASSYRAEVLAVIAAQLILSAVRQNEPREYPKVLVYCDNMGGKQRGTSRKNKHSLTYCM